MAKSRMASSKPPSSSPPPPSSSEMDRSGGSRGTVVASNHHSHSCYNIDVLADAAAERAARRRAGMCEQCGVVQTHTIVLWGRRRKPIQVCVVVFHIAGNKGAFWHAYYYYDHVLDFRCAIICYLIWICDVLWTGEGEGS